MDSVDEEQMLAARAKLAARFGDSSRTGGKGSVRRKKKMVHKNPLGDDKKLKSALKKLQVQQLPGIEEVNFFQEDSSILHFKNPSVQANVKDNLFVVTGAPETKSPMDLMPGIIPQMSSDQMKFLQQYAEQYKNEQAGQDEDIPDLVENFDDVAEAETN